MSKLLMAILALLPSLPIPGQIDGFAVTLLDRRIVGVWCLEPGDHYWPVVNGMPRPKLQDLTCRHKPIFDQYKQTWRVGTEEWAHE